MKRFSLFSIVAASLASALPISMTDAAAAAAAEAPPSTSSSTTAAEADPAVGATGESGAGTAPEASTASDMALHTSTAAAPETQSGAPTESEQSSEVAEKPAPTADAPNASGASSAASESASDTSSSAAAAPAAAGIEAAPAASTTEPPAKVVPNAAALHVDANGTPIPVYVPVGDTVNVSAASHAEAKERFAGLLAKLYSSQATPGDVRDELLALGTLLHLHSTASNQAALTGQYKAGDVA